MIKRKDLSGVIFSCFSAKSRVGEPFFKEHLLCYVLSREIETFDGSTYHTFKAGELFLYKRNTLGKFLKYPSNGLPYKSISFVLDRDFLMEYNVGRKSERREGNQVVKAIFPVPTDSLLTNFLHSLSVWFDETIPEALINLKKQEAVLLLLKNYPDLANVLFDYADPGKIDLEAFMNQNFKFNIAISQLAYLTGRSLATFKRDFEKKFHMSPHRWIKTRRLQEAYYLISKRGRRPNDIYIEVGFETLAHFSHAFKKHFGENPSALRIKKPGTS
ncbi:AraC-like DNA-binding protein [Pedobacter sp. W3I1]|uniref:helix-turn-helix domain-containing protein n=1 Tax=Pedobacter sp. W3I1 TaxID=3042291 RepID=UPI00278343CA|nr:AraC family transcriptional regulator [Pedobacter sp. W3I1]MDQ0640302.1 AraC-like DNA-binding protein [Pedobacter sp. W3I1]